MIRIVVAPDSFKESLSAASAAAALARGLRRALPGARVEEIPVADGGEGTVDALVKATGGRFCSARVTGPLGDPVEATFGVLGDGETAVLEMAAASGLPLVPESERDPLLTTTYGTGQLVVAALDAGCTRVVIGLGGSATNDGGAGMAQAVGIRLLDEAGSDIGRGGGALASVRRIDRSGRDPRLDLVSVEAACDVTNPILGPLGATRVFGPQKGATPDSIPALESGLERLVQALGADPGPVDYRTLPGGGAAGGLGVGVVAFLGGRLRPGIELVLDAVRFEERIKGADLVITGEGRLDGQTGSGKAPAGVARLAARHGVPVIGIGGDVTPDASALHDRGFGALFSIVPGPASLAEALERAEQFCERTGEQIGRTLTIGAKIGRRPAWGEGRFGDVGNIT